MWDIPRSRLRDGKGRLHKPLFRPNTSKGTRLHVKRRRSLRLSWEREMAGRGWVMILPRDLDRDLPAYADPAAPRRKLPPRQLGNPIPLPELAPLPPADGSEAGAWEEWEAATRRVMRFRRPITSVSLRRRARLVRFCRGRPMWYLARKSGLRAARLSQLLRGKRSKGNLRVPTWNEARRLARALETSLEELGRYLDAVALDPIS